MNLRVSMTHWWILWCPVTQSPYRPAVCCMFPPMQEPGHCWTWRGPTWLLVWQYCGSDCRQADRHGHRIRVLICYPYHLKNALYFANPSPVAFARSTSSLHALWGSPASSWAAVWRILKPYSWCQVGWSSWNRSHRWSPRGRPLAAWSTPSWCCRRCKVELSCSLTCPGSCYVATAGETWQRRGREADR